MKTFTNFLLAFTILFSAANVLVAQQTEKELKKDVSSRAIRSARKEAKNIKKQDIM